jgi:hypothetical protein
MAAAGRFCSVLIWRSIQNVNPPSLVVFQFVIAITLVCGMVIVTRQLKFMQEADLGFSAYHKIVLPLRTETARNTYPALCNELGKLSTVKDVLPRCAWDQNNLLLLCFNHFGYPCRGIAKKLFERK